MVQTEAKAKEVQALKDGKLEKSLKSATAAREELSKDLVKAASEMNNKKSALDEEVKALEAFKKVSYLANTPRADCEMQTACVLERAVGRRRNVRSREDTVDPRIDGWIGRSIFVL